MVQNETSYFHNLILWGNWINPLSNAAVPDADEAKDRTIKLGAPDVTFEEKTRETPDAPLANWPIIICLTSNEQTYRQEMLTDTDGILNVDLFELIRKANLRSAEKAAIELRIATNNQETSDTLLLQSSFVPAEVVRGRLPFLAKQQGPNIWAAPQLRLQFNALQIAKGPEDGLFRGGDQGQLKIAVKNQGKGDAFDVRLNLTGKMGAIIAEEVSAIPIIRAGTTSQFAVPLELPLLAAGGQAQLTAQAIEALGNDSAPLAVQLNYYRAHLPQLAVSDIWFKDGREGLARGNGNGILENSEQVEVWIAVTNTGDGTALGATVSLAEKDLVGTVLHREAALGDIPPATTKVANLAIALPAVLARTEDKLIISGRDSRGVGGFDKELSVEYRQRQPQLAVVAEIQSETGHDSITQVEKGKGGELVLTVINHGDYAAEEVAVYLQSTADGVALPENMVLIGRIPAKGKSSTVRIPFAVQNRFAASQTELQIEISQQDFSPIIASASVQVAEPKVCTVQVGGTPDGIADTDREPVVLITYPHGDTRLRAEKIRLAGAVLDDYRVRNIEVWVNRTRYRDLPGRGITITTKPGKANRRFFEMEVPLNEGGNLIRVVATDSQGQRSEESLNVFREASKKRMHVLVIGIDEYDDSDIPAVPYAQADARSIYEFFRNSPHSPARAEDVHLLTATADENGCDTSYRGIRKAISRYLAQKATNSEDVVLLYFAGHGEIGDHPTKGKTYYLLARDTERNDLLGTSMGIAELQSLWASIPTKQRILMVDACNSANLIPDIKGAVLAAAQKGQKALELSTQEHGLFTWGVLQGLKGKADGIFGPPDGRISIVELNAYLQREVRNMALRRGGDQAPVTSLPEHSKNIFLKKEK